MIGIRKCLSILGLAALGGLSSPALANPAPIGSPGGALLPWSLKKVSGVSIHDETLVIRDGMKGKIPSFAPGGGTMDVPSVRYHSRYHFFNATGRSMSLKVGFPVIAYSMRAGGSYGGLSDLTASYGEARLPVHQSSISKPMVFPRETLTTVMRELQSCRLVSRVAESSDFVDLSKLGPSTKTARKALVNSRALSTKQITHVINELRKVAFGGSDESLIGQSLIWYTFEIPLDTGLSKELTVSYDSFVPFGGDHSISYILSTGRLWGNRIERLNVTVEPDSEFVSKGGRYEIRPSGKFQRSKDGGFLFESENVDPTFDVYVKRIEKSSED